MRPGELDLVSPKGTGVIRFNPEGTIRTSNTTEKKGVRWIFNISIWTKALIIDMSGVQEILFLDLNGLLRFYILRVL